MLLRTAAALSLAALLGGCLNAASDGSRPPGSEEALQQVTQDEPVVRRMIALGLTNTPQLKGNILTGRSRLTSATIAGPHLHQDPITRHWAIFYCVEGQTTGIFSRFAKQVAVTRTARGWRGSASNEKIGIACTQPKRPFPELVTLTNELADAQAPKP